MDGGADASWMCMHGWLGSGRSSTWHGEACSVNVMIHHLVCQSSKNLHHQFQQRKIINTHFCASHERTGWHFIIIWDWNFTHTVNWVHVIMTEPSIWNGENLMKHRIQSCHPWKGRRESRHQKGFLSWQPQLHVLLIGEFQWSGPLTWWNPQSFYLVFLFDLGCRWRQLGNVVQSVQVYCCGICVSLECLMNLHHFDSVFLDLCVKAAFDCQVRKVSWWWPNLGHFLTLCCELVVGLWHMLSFLVAWLHCHQCFNKFPLMWEKKQKSTVNTVGIDS